ncbi:hypothetical protein M422DRAFT_246259 [Sphaerobolus stellatus SS14]|nr:hypothetical protein M422DRAFT_246259 [Sphaerobolus stellatus SS14]
MMFDGLAGFSSFVKIPTSIRQATARAGSKHSQTNAQPNNFIRVLSTSLQLKLRRRWRSPWPISGRIPASSLRPRSMPAGEQKRKMGTCNVMVSDARTKLQEPLQFKENLKNDYFEAATLLAPIRRVPDEILVRILLFDIPVPFDLNKTDCCNSGL